MAKKTRKKKRRRAKGSGAPAKATTNQGRSLFSRLVAGVAAVALVAILVVAGWGAFSSRTSSPDAGGTTASDQTVLSQVQTFPCSSRQHVPRGTRVDYPTDPPVCGPHYPTAVKPGFYTTEQVPEELVHSLEHGNVVIYYDRPAPEILDILKDVSRRYTGSWDGVVVVPRPGLGQALILTAWGKMLRLDAPSKEAIRAFLDAYRGRGPEHPVR